MKLNKKEIDILSLIDEKPVDSFVKFASKNLNYPQKEILDIIEKLLDYKLIEKIILPQDKEEIEWYFRTKEANSIKLDDKVRYLGDFGSKFGETE